jgi:hypothetical protein
LSGFNDIVVNGKAPEIRQSFKTMALKLTYEDNPVVVVTLK